MIDAPPITAKELFESLVPAPPDDTCRTCRFWKARLYDDDYWGACSNNNFLLRTVNVPELTAADNGCRFHRPKEAG